MFQCDSEKSNMKRNTLFFFCIPLRLHTFQFSYSLQCLLLFYTQLHTISTCPVFSLKHSLIFPFINWTVGGTKGRQHQQENTIKSFKGEEYSTFNSGDRVAMIFCVKTSLYSLASLNQIV